MIGSVDTNRSDAGRESRRKIRGRIQANMIGIASARRKEIEATGLIVDDTNASTMMGIGGSVVLPISPTPGIVSGYRKRG